MRKQRLNPEQKVILRDGATFAVKLWLDGIKDMVFGFLALGAVVIDLVRRPRATGYLFYKVMKLGNRLDDVIDPYGVGQPPELRGTKEPFDDLRG